MSQSEVIFPIPSFAEQEGHFINVQGKVQKIHAAFDPKGESRFVWEWLEDIAEQLKPNAKRIAG